MLQGDRYSLGYFANARACTLFQGPKHLYPPVTFPQILEQKMKNCKAFMKQDRDMTDEEYFEFQKGATGPEFEAVGMQPSQSLLFSLHNVLCHQPRRCDVRGLFQLKYL